MPSVEDRFEMKVDRTGTHHVWSGAKKADGTGVLRANGKLTTATRVAWELAHGPLPPEARVKGCPDEHACVRIDHLSVTAGPPKPNLTRGRRGGGSKRKVRPGVWQLTVYAGEYDDGRPRRVHRTVHAGTETEASALLAELVVEVTQGPRTPSRELRDLTVDAAIELFLTEHLLLEKGREPKTVDDYRRLHAKWFSQAIGNRRVRDVDEEAIDRVFGHMRKAGLSRSRMNQARSLYKPFFDWARSRRITNRSPMAAFKLPTSKHVSHERTPPEVDEMSIFLNHALATVPEVAPVLVLGAVTGMRRGELVGLRRSRIEWSACRLTVDSAVAESRRVKGTKTRKERTFHVDAETIAMLKRHCDEMNKRGAEFGAGIVDNGFVFSLEPDCSKPMPPDYLTKRVGVLKEHLGIAAKKPETIEIEDKALALFRQKPASKPVGRTGPSPKGGLSFREIGERMGRSERWAMLAVASAERREAAISQGLDLDFDGSILALRKFTSSELLDAGFNISMVAQRQGHGPQVLIKHYSKSRRSADRKAAEHLGRVVHGAAT